MRGNMKNIRNFIYTMLVFPVLLGANVDAETFSSSAEQWSALGSNKQVYIDGFCAGAGGTDLGRIHCGDTLKGINSKSPPAFCGQTYEAFGPVPAGKGIGFVNSFYKDSSHSDVPLRVVIRYFNDKSCSENQVSGRISEYQEKLLCMRQASNMISMGVSGDVLKAQQAKCEKLP